MGRVPATPTAKDAKGKRPRGDGSDDGVVKTPELKRPRRARTDRNEPALPSPAKTPAKTKGKERPDTGNVVDMTRTRSLSPRKRGEKTAATEAPPPSPQFPRAVTAAAPKVTLSPTMARFQLLYAKFRAFCSQNRDMSPELAKKCLAMGSALQPAIDAFNEADAAKRREEGRERARRRERGLAPPSPQWEPTATREEQDAADLQVATSEAARKKARDRWAAASEQGRATGALQAAYARYVAAHDALVQVGQGRGADGEATLGFATVAEARDCADAVETTLILAGNIARWASVKQPYADVE